MMMIGVLLWCNYAFRVFVCACARTSLPNCPLGSELRGRRRHCICFGAQSLVAVERGLQGHVLKCHLCNQLSCLGLPQQCTRPSELGPGSLPLANEFASNSVFFIWEHWPAVHDHLASTKKSNRCTSTHLFLEPLILWNDRKSSQLSSPTYAKHDLVKRLRWKDRAAPGGACSRFLAKPRMVFCNDFKLLAVRKWKERPDRRIKCDESSFFILSFGTHWLALEHEITFDRLYACYFRLHHGGHLPSLEAYACSALQNHPAINVLHPDLHLLGLLRRVWLRHKGPHWLHVTHWCDEVHGKGTRLEP
mmetsp:Transcript_153804/g.294852  ORF Transcript_153804/g.294852 Transcript_153804/m.294852 type:complete len:305 (+) Transcript_153804:3-917(+)